MLENIVLVLSYLGSFAIAHYLSKKEEMMLAVLFYIINLILGVAIVATFGLNPAFMFLVVAGMIGAMIISSKIKYGTWRTK